MKRKCVNKLFGCRGVTVDFIRKNFEQQLEKSENTAILFDFNFEAMAHIFVSKRGYRFIIFDDGDSWKQEKLVTPSDFRSTIISRANDVLDEGSISISKVGTMNFD